jgi:hypothetical protein
MLALLSFSLGAMAADEGKVKALLKQADDFRLAIASGRVETEVRSFKGDALDKTRLYAVYLKPGRRSLVLFRTASERGQKMLMLGDDYWLMMPSSQRPLRITAMQKLLGEASTGDIATMTWSDDYDGAVSGEDVIDGQPASSSTCSASARASAIRASCSTWRRRIGTRCRPSCTWPPTSWPSWRAFAWARSAVAAR